MPGARGNGLGIKQALHTVLTNKRNIMERNISQGYAYMQGCVDVKNEEMLVLLKSIKVVKPPWPDGELPWVIERNKRD